MKIIARKDGPDNGDGSVWSDVFFEREGRTVVKKIRIYPNRKGLIPSEMWLLLSLCRAAIAADIDFCGTAGGEPREFAGMPIGRIPEYLDGLDLFSIRLPK